MPQSLTAAHPLHFSKMVRTIHFSLVGQNDFPATARRIDGQRLLEALLDVRTPDALCVRRRHVLLVVGHVAHVQLLVLVRHAASGGGSSGCGVVVVVMVRGRQARQPVGGGSGGSGSGGAGSSSGCVNRGGGATAERTARTVGAAGDRRPRRGDAAGAVCGS